MPSAFLSIFRDESAAQAVVNASPMRYRLVSDAAPNEAHKAEQNAMEGKTDARITEDENGEQEKVFELSASHSQFDHEHYIANEPMFGPWTPIDRKHSFFGGGLEIPRSLMSSGLRDWETNGLKWRNVGGDLEGAAAPLEGLGVRNLGANGSGKDGVNTQWRVDQRRKKRLEEEWKEGVMGGLKRYGDQSAKEKAPRDDDRGGEHLGQEKRKQSKPKEPGFGPWPGKDFRDVLREKEAQRAKEREAELNENGPRVWPVQ